MLDDSTGGIYLIVEFDWPQPFLPEYGQKAARLHQVLKGKDWIQGIVAGGSGGIGPGPSSIWVFWLENYAALDRLMDRKADQVSEAYHDFFQSMPVVHDVIREKVRFL